MTELTQPQQFVVWYERICRDRDFAARYFNLADRTIRKEMEQRMIKLTDTEMLNWTQDHVKVIRQLFENGEYEIEWIGDHRDHKTRGKTLPDAIAKAVAIQKENSN